MRHGAHSKDQILSTSISLKQQKNAIFSIQKNKDTAHNNKNSKYPIEFVLLLVFLKVKWSFMCFI